jgi:hypothetical protein
MVRETGKIELVSVTDVLGSGLVLVSRSLTRRMSSQLWAVAAAASIALAQKQVICGIRDAEVFAFTFTGSLQAHLWY